MTSPAAYLDYFLVEANEYIERLDQAFADAGDQGPDARAVLRTARALRGSATMTRQFGIAQVARSLERVARALADGSTAWDAALSAAVISAVDDLRILLRNTRNWGVAEERRVAQRVEELESLVPEQPQPDRETPPGGSAGQSYLAAETMALAHQLDILTSAPGNAGAQSNVLERVRTLRGLAGIAEMTSLFAIIDTVERAVKPLALRNSAASEPQLDLFRAAAALLRLSSGDLLSGRAPDPDSAEQVEYDAAASVLAVLTRGSADRIVPVSDLFYADGPQIISAAAKPPTSPRQRFRLEIVSQAEHLRAIIAPVMATAGGVGAAVPKRPADVRELLDALGALGETAGSFGEIDVAEFVAEWTECDGDFDLAALSALDGAASLLSRPPADDSWPELVRSLGHLRPARPRVAPPTGQNLVDFLERGIIGLNELSQAPLGNGATLTEENVVPIETLLYRGEAALRRAKEIRDEIRRSSREASREDIAELFDLLDLAS
ncbi:MAG: Hpt domain-containing protein [Gemmatimonadaceae bacterium]